MIKFFIPGNPIGKARPRFDGRTHRMYTPAKTAKYEKTISAAAQEAMNRNGLHRATEAPCAVFMDMAYQVPKSYTKSRKAQCYSQKKQPGKPDADNVAKAILDAMNGIVYDDDRLAVSLHIIKRYAVEGEEAGVTVTVIPLENPSALNGILDRLIDYTFSQ